MRKPVVEYVMRFTQRKSNGANASRPMPCVGQWKVGSAKRSRNSLGVGVGSFDSMTWPRSGLTAASVGPSSGAMECCDARSFVGALSGGSCVSKV